MDPALHQDCSPLGMVGGTSIVQRKDKRARSGGQSRGRLPGTNLFDVILHGLLASRTGHIHVIVA
jgi:hypothetical protein